MAGGKQSTRQKMINLMYLVFIVMLALNMDKKVLSSFGYLNEKMESSNITKANDIAAVLQDLELKASEQPEKYGALNDKSVQVNQISNEFFNYLGAVKDTLLFTIDSELHKDYEFLDTETAGNEFFFLGGEKLTPKGKEFVANINKYRDDIIAVLGEEIKPDILDQLNYRFDTSDQELKGGLTQPWIRNRYEGFPLVATLTNISVIQADVKTSETDIYNSLLGRQLSADASISENTYQAIVLSEKPAYFEGEVFKGTVVLGKYDSSLKPERLTLNGENYTERNEKGTAVVSFKAGRVGENEIIGEFVFKQNGEDVIIPVKSSYLVVPKPNSAVVSADKMNVVYRGVDNPITISIPGISNINVNASAPGLRRLKGTKYMLSPGKGKEVKIKVSGKTDDGEIINTPAVVFRIKDIPPPAATIRNQYGSINMPKSSLAKSSIAAALIDFDFDLKLRVSSFKVKIPGQSTIIVNGTRFDARAQSALVKAKRGDIVSIFDVKATIIGNSSYRLKGVLPLSVVISN
ncbi:gliding motility protein GldM [Flavicella sp.]|uniref:type IX secretion system motor protein PorM/GldM n=1 Tax=Flavicella sp. TaxID=2957742 RepID=UPI0030168625